MKYLIITDIHGTPLYLDEVLKKEHFDKMLLLGDVLPHGPRNDLPNGYNPKKVIKILNEMKNKIICVRGNCDAEVDDMVLEFPISSLALVVIDNINFYLTHGHHFNPTTPLNTENSVVLYGHTHISKIEHVGSNIYINPGSISIPKDGHHSYATLENSLLLIKDIETGEILNKIDFSKEAFIW